MKAHVNIGSNLGDSRSIIERAIAEIFLRFPTDTRRSNFVTSPPWGYDSPHEFLNIGVEFDTDLPPEQLLRELLAIQHGICADPHRNPDGTYTDRLLDIDLIFLGDTIHRSPTLTLPHPRLHLRPFVLLPIAELSPRWVHPHLHLTAPLLLTNL